MEAAAQFEAAGVHREEVPRMLMTHDRGGAIALEDWVSERKENDPGIARWWGLWLASQGRSEEAYKALELAGDTLSQVPHLSWS
jgi:hypothetical protein